MTLDVQTSDDELVADPSRVVLRLFLPGEEAHDRGSRVTEIIDRVLALPEEGLEEAANEMLASFDRRTDNLEGILTDHTVTVGFHGERAKQLSRGRKIALGGAFTSEYAIEGAALCNPSAVPHPDQSGLNDGQLRVAVALRGIGEETSPRSSSPRRSSGQGGRGTSIPAGSPSSGLTLPNSVGGATTSRRHSSRRARSPSSCAP